MRTTKLLFNYVAILGFHSMMNQDQYHASLLNKGQPVGLGWDGITKASKQKIFPIDPPNSTDPDETIKKVQDDDTKFIDLNWNNIKVDSSFVFERVDYYILFIFLIQNISEEKLETLFEALGNNTHLETLSLANTGLTDKTSDKLAQALEKNNTLKVVNVETNIISPSGVVRLIKSLLKTKSVEEFRASNQVRFSVLTISMRKITFVLFFLRSEIPSFGK